MITDSVPTLILSLLVVQASGKRRTRKRGEAIEEERSP